MTGWSEFADFLAALDPEDRARISRYAFLELPEDAQGICNTLETYASENPRTTPSQLVSTAISQAVTARDLEFARDLGPVALETAASTDDTQLAHVAIAQTHFQNRRDPAELEGFERHCRAAIDAGHSGTFCYERLAVLYEYRGDLEEAASITRRAVEALRNAGDERSATRFEKRLQRLARKRG
jgi:hypothetical protein